MENLDGQIKTSLFGKSEAKKKKKEKKIPATSTTSKKPTVTKSKIHKENQPSTSAQFQKSDRRKAFSPVDENLPNLVQENSNSEEDHSVQLNNSSDDLFSLDATSTIQTTKKGMNSLLIKF